MSNLFKSLPTKEQNKMVLQVGIFVVLFVGAIAALIFGPEFARLIVLGFLALLAFIILILGLLVVALIFVYWKTYHG